MFQNYKLALYAGVIAFTLSVSAFLGYKKAQYHYEPLLASENTQIGALNAANAELKAQVDEQNL